MFKDILKDYTEKGVAIIPNVFSEDECAELKAKATKSYPSYMIGGKIVEKLDARLIP